MDNHARPDVYIFDVDGTITTTNGPLTAPMAEALMALNAQSPVVLSTGRSLGGLAPVLAQAPLPGPHAVSNGAAIVTNQRTSHVFNALTPTDCNEIREYLDSRGFICVYCLADGNLQIDHSDDRMVDILETGAWPAIIKPFANDQPVLKILTLCLEDEEEDIRTICANTTEIHRTQYNMIEWTAPGSNKGVAFGHQIAILGLEHPVVFAIGDSENDLPLLAKATFAIAMPDAAPVVKAAADHVLDEPLLAWVQRQVS
ncbi:HAD family hydrolase [Stomatohabitans albus]|uniref:HAD family hydrolase n=1 Tax=Stomatohabitans albus TaxID=3110766 RepID=UPI00300C598F